MIRRRRRADEARVSQTDLQRAAAVTEFTDRGWPRATAALTALARHPFDDGVEPVDGPWEDRTRRASIGFWMQMRMMQDPGAVGSLARDTLVAYRDTAIAAGEPYYSRRYDATLDQGDRGH